MPVVHRSVRIAAICIIVSLILDSTSMKLY